MQIYPVLSLSLSHSFFRYKKITTLHLRNTCTRHVRIFLTMKRSFVHNISEASGLCLKRKTSRHLKVYSTNGISDALNCVKSLF